MTLIEALVIPVAQDGALVTPLFWACACAGEAVDFIHPITSPCCYGCGAEAVERPPARVEDLSHARFADPAAERLRQLALDAAEEAQPERYGVPF